MNKLELISTLKEKANLTKSEAAEVIKIFFDSLSDSFVKGERGEIRGFCSFHIKRYKSRNPKSSQKVIIPPKRLPFFKCGKELKERVDY